MYVPKTDRPGSITTVRRIGYFPVIDFWLCATVTRIEGLLAVTIADLISDSSAILFAAVTTTLGGGLGKVDRSRGAGPGHLNGMGITEFPDLFLAHIGPGIGLGGIAVLAQPAGLQHRLGDGAGAVPAVFGLRCPLAPLYGPQMFDAAPGQAFQQVLIPVRDQVQKLTFELLPMARPALLHLMDQIGGLYLAFVLAVPGPAM